MIIHILSQLSILTLVQVFRGEMEWKEYDICTHRFAPVGLNAGDKYMWQGIAASAALLVSSCFQVSKDFSYFMKRLAIFSINCTQIHVTYFYLN